MPLDVVDLRSFYASPLGRLAQRTASDVVRAWWRDTVGLTILGCGFALPYLEAFRDEAMRTLAFMPAEQGVVHWPPHGAAQVSATALVESDLLPLPDGSIDRVLLVHLLEVTDHPRDLLEEVWRVLTPGGRMIIVAPNRRGLWARVDTTPFGHGQPYSRRLGLPGAGLHVVEATKQLYRPVLLRKPLRRRLPVFEPALARAGLRRRRHGEDNCDA